MCEVWEWGVLHSCIIENFGLLGCDAASIIGVRRFEVTWRLHLQGFKMPVLRKGRGPLIRRCNITS